MALTLDAIKRKLKMGNFVCWGQQMGLNKKQIDVFFSSYKNRRLEDEKWVRNSFLSENMKAAYIGLLNERIERFNWQLTSFEIQ